MNFPVGIFVTIDPQDRSFDQADAGIARESAQVGFEPDSIQVPATAWWLADEVFRDKPLMPPVRERAGARQVPGFVDQVVDAESLQNWPRTRCEGFADFSNWLPDPVRPIDHHRPHAMTSQRDARRQPSRTSTDDDDRLA